MKPLHTPNRLRFAVEALLVRGTSVHASGWAFHPEVDVVGVQLHFEFGPDHQPETLHANHNRHHPVAASRFRSVERAQECGFLLFGTLTASAVPSRVEIRIALSDGTVVGRVLPRLRPTAGSGEPTLSLPRRDYHVRALELIRSGRARELVDKVRSRLRGAPKDVLQDEAAVIARLRGVPARDIRFIIDHDLGGGANLFRERLIEGWLREGCTVVVLTFHVASLAFAVILRSASSNSRWRVPRAHTVFGALVDTGVGELVFNNAVAFPDTEAMAEELTKLKQMTGAPLRVMLHDHHAICPSPFLLNHIDAYCGVPNLDVCNGCLPQNRHVFGPNGPADRLGAWRATWSRMLAAADEVVAFSRTSAALIERAFPDLDRAKVHVRPHDPAPTPLRPVRVKNTGRLHVGVVGHIALHKGSTIVEALAHEIDRRSANVSITVIGTLHSKLPSSVVTQTGSYRTEELPDLLEAHDVNVMLFPSIVPETYSFVVQELMTMQLPIAAFDLGAPAERLATYRHGHLIQSNDPAVVFDELMGLFQRTYQPK